MEVSRPLFQEHCSRWGKQNLAQLAETFELPYLVSIILASQLRWGEAAKTFGMSGPAGDYRVGLWAQAVLQSDKRKMLKTSQSNVLQTSNARKGSQTGAEVKTKCKSKITQWQWTKRKCTSGYQKFIARGRTRKYLAFANAPGGGDGVVRLADPGCSPRYNREGQTDRQTDTDSIQSQNKLSSTR